MYCYMIIYIFYLYSLRRIFSKKADAGLCIILKKKDVFVCTDNSEKSIEGQIEMGNPRQGSLEKDIQESGTNISQAHKGDFS